MGLELPCTSGSLSGLGQAVWVTIAIAVVFEGVHEMSSTGFYWKTSLNGTILRCSLKQWKWSVSNSVVSDSLGPQGPTKLLCPWDSPGKNTGMGSHSFFRGSFQLRDRTWVPYIADRFFYHLSHQARNRALKAIALGQPREMEWGGSWEGSSGWGTHVHSWLIHVTV